MNTNTDDIVTRVLDGIEFVIRYCEILDKEDSTPLQSLIVKIALNSLCQAQDALEVLRRTIDHERVVW